MTDSVPTPTPAWLYGLSAGRTGTVFLTELLSRYAPNARVVHEPHPTRQQMMLGNLRNDWRVFGNFTKSWVQSTRLARSCAVPGAYVEFNPFLCAVTDLLPDPERPLRIVHIVRDPVTWAQSMTVFKASRRFRKIIDFIPFAKSFPSPRPKGWGGLSQYDRNLWRWVWCNQRILDLQPHSEAFVTLHYEDIFSDRSDVRDAAVSRLFDTLGLPVPHVVDWKLFETPANPSPSGRQVFDPTAAARIAGPLARELGYDY